jgi:hypothetical protein
MSPRPGKPTPYPLLRVELLKCVDIVGNSDQRLPIDYIIKTIEESQLVPDDAKKYCRALLNILKKYTNVMSPRDLDLIITISSMIDGISVKSVITEILARPQFVIDPGEGPN